MRYSLLLILIFSIQSVGAQVTDTLFFNVKEKQVEKGEKYTLYKITSHSDGRKIVTWYFKKGKLFSQYIFLPNSEEKDFFYQLDISGDTLKKINYKKGQPEFFTYYEGGKKTKINRRVNDSTYYSFGVSGGKYITSKSLFIGDIEYYFQGKDSILNREKFSLAFKKNEPNSDYWIVKYKMLPWVLGEDVGMNYTLGVEYTLGRVHSLEVTATYFDWDIDQEDNFGNPLPSIYNVRRSLQIGYRYYFPKFKNQKNNYRLFITPYVRYSKWKDYYAEGAVTNYFQNESWNYITGINLGICLDISGEDDASYTEFFVGPTYFSRYTEEGFTDNNLVIQQNYYTQKFGFRLGMNFCGLLDRKRR